MAAQAVQVATAGTISAARVGDPAVLACQDPCTDPRLAALCTSHQASNTQAILRCNTMASLALQTSSTRTTSHITAAKDPRIWALTRASNRR